MRSVVPTTVWQLLIRIVTGVGQQGGTVQSCAAPVCLMTVFCFQAGNELRGAHCCFSAVEELTKDAEKTGQEVPHLQVPMQMLLDYRSARN